MKKEKMILSLIALVVASGSAVAFKSHLKSSGAHTLWTKSNGSTCVKKACFTTNGGSQSLPCANVASGYRTALKVSGVTHCDNVVSSALLTTTD